MSQHLPSTEGDGHLRPAREGAKKEPESPKVTSSRKGTSCRRTKTIQKKPVGGEEQLLNVVKAAKLLGMKRATLRELACQGRIPGLVIMGSLFFRLSHIERLLNQRTEKTVGDHNARIRAQS